MSYANFSDIIPKNPEVLSYISYVFNQTVEIKKADITLLLKFFYLYKVSFTHLT